jgi:hypothetical protein
MVSLSFLLAKLIKAVIGLVGQVFTAALSNPSTEEYQKAKNAIEQAVRLISAKGLSLKDLGQKLRLP